jgi:hypothetical protein
MARASCSLWYLNGAAPPGGSAIAKVVLSTYIEPTQKAALEALSRSTRVPVAEYVREAVDLILARYAHLVRAAAGGGGPAAKGGRGRAGRDRRGAQR